MTWGWWITAVEVPILACLFWLIQHGRRENERSLMKIYSETQSHVTALHEKLADSKVEDSRLYASIDDLQNTETRLTNHLLRIEAQVALLATQDRASCNDATCPLAKRYSVQNAQGDPHARRAQRA